MIHGWRMVAILAMCLVSCELVEAQPRRPARAKRANSADAQKSAAEAAGTTDSKSVKEFWSRFEQVEKELTARRIRPPVWNSPEGRIAGLIDKAHVGYFATEDGITRYFALHLQIGNDTAQPVVIPRDKIQAVINGDTFPTKEIGPKLVHHGFPYGGEYYPLEACQPAKEVTAPAHGVAATWLVYPDQPLGQTLPTCEVSLQVGTHTIEVPVNGVQRALLDMHVDVMGPHQAAALITLGSMLNTFNVYALIDEVESLAAQKTNRLVIQWKSKAPQPESQLTHWLHNSALGLGSGRTASEQLPTFPSSLKELHLVESTPGMFLAAEYSPNPQSPPKVHKSAFEAVSAALRGLYITLPREELLHEIRRGQSLSRAAALIHGAARLDVSDLPLVIELSKSDDAAVRHAALSALGDFDQPAAFERLEQALRSGDESDRTTATVALAESRFQAPRDRFRDLLKADPGLQRQIALVLAQRPRSEWADLLFQHARDHQGKLQTEIVRALVQIDDPRVVELLAPALTGQDKSLQDFAFQVLSERHDERSEKLAAEFVLQRLRFEPPDAAAMAFLNRTKDQRALPLLLKHLNSARDKGPLINLLGQIGDSPVGDALINRFDKLQPNEQVAALLALRQLRHPQFVEIAAKALNSKQEMIVSHAIQGLAQHGGPEAERLLSEALQTSTRAATLEGIAVTLANLGTSNVRSILQQARNSELPQRRLAATKGLEQLRRNSPGWSSCEQGYAYAQEKKWDDALDAFKLASQIDPQLPDAHTGAGDVHLKQSHYKKAEKAFAEACKLDNTNGLACCGLAIAQVMLGRLEEGRQTVEKARPQFPQDVNFSYNAACFYGRAVELTAKELPSTDRDARLKKYREQALSDLAQAVKLGFRDADWMQKDPDLNSLHELPEFQKLVNEAEK